MILRAGVYDVAPWSSSFLRASSNCRMMPEIICLSRSGRCRLNCDLYGAARLVPEDSHRSLVDDEWLPCPCQISRRGGRRTLC